MLFWATEFKILSIFLLDCLCFSCVVKSSTVDLTNKNDEKDGIFCCLLSWYWQADWLTDWLTCFFFRQKSSTTKVTDWLTHFDLFWNVLLVHCNINGKNCFFTDLFVVLFHLYCFKIKIACYVVMVFEMVYFLLLYWLTDCYTLWFFCYFDCLKL